MKKLLSLLAALCLLAGCAGSPSNPEATDTPDADPTPEIVENVKAETSLSVLAPTGAPALALLDLLEGSPEQIETVDGADVLQAAFINPTPEYDVILAPTNLGVKLASAGKTEYRLAGIVTWGNVFIVGADEADLHNPDKVFAAFGETSIPGLVFNAVLEQLDIQAEIVWYAAVTDAQSALLSGNADAALIAEPAATATIAKAKQSDMELSILADLQEAWKEKTGFDGYPQAAVFVLNSAYEEKAEEVDAFLDQIAATLSFGNEAANSEALAAQVDSIGTEILGTPAGAVVAKAYSGMNLRYQPAEQFKEELKAFLELFDVTFGDEVFLK